MCGVCCTPKSCQFGVPKPGELCLWRCFGQSKGVLFLYLHFYLCILWFRLQTVLSRTIENSCAHFLFTTIWGARVSEFLEAQALGSTGVSAAESPGQRWEVSVPDCSKTQQEPWWTALNSAVRDVVLCHSQLQEMKRSLKPEDLQSVFLRKCLLPCLLNTRCNWPLHSVHIRNMPSVLSSVMI